MGGGGSGNHPFHYQRYLFWSTTYSPNFFQTFRDFGTRSHRRIYVWNPILTNLTMSNKKIVFSNCLQTYEICICNFFTLDVILVGKVTTSVSLRKKFISKDFRAAGMANIMTFFFFWFYFILFFFNNQKKLIFFF